MVLHHLTTHIPVQARNAIAPGPVRNRRTEFPVRNARGADSPAHSRLPRRGSDPNGPDATTAAPSAARPARSEALPPAILSCFLPASPDEGFAALVSGRERRPSAPWLGIGADPYQETLA